jgi:hypothetical protein
MRFRSLADVSSLCSGVSLDADDAPPDDLVLL